MWFWQTKFGLRKAVYNSPYAQTAYYVAKCQDAYHIIVPNVLEK